MGEERGVENLEKELALLRARIADDERCLKGLKQATDALVLAEEKLKFIMDNAGDIIFSLDASGIVTYMNKAIERYSNFRRDEVIGQPFLRFIHPDDLDKLLMSMERTVAGRLEPLEYRVIDKDGTVYRIRTFSLPQFRDDDYEGVTGIMTVLETLP